MSDILNAEIELVKLLKENEEFRDTFKRYLKEVFRSAKELCKRNHLTVYYDFKKSRFTTYEFMHDWEYISGDGVDIINLLKIERNSRYSDKNTINSIIKNLQEEIEHRKCCLS